MPDVAAELCTGATPDPRLLSQRLHAHGVNVRHMGRVRSSVGYTGNISRLLLGEIVVRTLKNMLRKRLRDILKNNTDQSGQSESLFESETVFFLNQTTGRSEESRIFLAVDVVQGIRERFGQDALTDIEAANLPAALGPPYAYPLIIERLLYCVGVKLSKISRFSLMFPVMYGDFNLFFACCLGAILRL